MEDSRTSEPRTGMRSIAYYTSAHGYGHGVRTCDILQAFTRAHPDIPVILTTALPEDFLRNRLGDANVTIRNKAFDVGMVQLDSVRVDIPETLERVCALYDRREELIEQESEFLRENDVALVVADIPAIPIEAAKAAGLPAIAIANFAWDWIYSEFENSDSRWQRIIDQFSEGYAKSDLLLRLPFAEELKAFPKKEDVPLVASPGTEQRERIVELTGCSPDKPWVLLSFTSLDWDEAALDKVEALDDYEFFTVKPLEWDRKNLHAIDREDVPFSDVLASVDIVISKPGFGLLSECIVNQKPLIYVERTEFLEYPILVEGVERYLRNIHLPQGKLYTGELKDALHAITTAPEPKKHMPAGGAQIVVERVMGFYEAARVNH